MTTVKIIGLVACLYVVVASLMLHIWFGAIAWFIVGVFMFVGFRYIEK